jgi:hypothetical protein
METHRRIRVLKVEGTRALEVPKSRRDRDRPLEEDAWQRSSATGNSPDREAIHRHIESRDIDNPVDQKSGNFFVENPT